MARKKISEFRAKKILREAIGSSYTGFSYDAQKGAFSLGKSLSVSKRFVIKVDQGVKKRYKNGLVLLDVKVSDLSTSIKHLEEKGYSKFIIEEYIRHDVSSERYLSLERIRSGIRILYSQKGGIDIEEKSSSVKELRYIPGTAISQVEKEIGLKEDILQKILHAFDEYYFSFLEINPLLLTDQGVIFLDTAAEVDSTAEFFVKGVWSDEDFVEPTKKGKTEEEKNIETLASKSQAAFNLTVLNPNGSICMLLSGGGASIVLADEVHNNGLGKSIANYGEYSGNPNEEETYIYTKNLLQLLLKSKSVKKVLIIGGGVANFTDIRITFRGVIKALGEEASSLRNAGVKVFVRRGGPNQEEGLADMSAFLTEQGLYGKVSGPDMILTDIVKEAIAYVRS